MNIKRYGRALAAVLLIAALMVPLRPVSAASNTIDGRIYYDQNNNGLQDSGEPGVPDILVSYGWGAGQKTALTDSNGDYAITNTTGTARVTVHSGWLRSNCNTMNCAVGAAGGNDFTTNNQWITLGAVNGANGATLNTGLVPDWGGTYPIPATPATAEIDIATRLTYVNGCSVAEKVCAPEDTAKIYLSFFNQGTEPISDPRFVVDLPVGHILNEGDSWFNPADVYNVYYPGADQVSVVEPFDSAKGTGVYQLNGTIPAGAIASVGLSATVEASAIDSPLPYASYDPYDKQPFVSVLSINESGDRDSSFCERNGGTWRIGSCAIAHQGVHNKTVGLDHTDVTGWSVANATPYTARSYDLALQVLLPDGQPDTMLADAPVDFWLRVTNQSAGEAGVRNVKLVGYVPAGMTFDVADNPGWVLESGQPVTYMTAQLLPGQYEDVPLKLRTATTATADDNGTPALSFGAEIASQQQITASSSGTYLNAVDADSTPDTNAANDGTPINDEIGGSLGGTPDDEDDADFSALLIGDIVAPNAPGNLTAVGVSDAQIDLSWDVATDNVGVTGYKVYRNGGYLQTVTGTTFSHTGLVADMPYAYTVKAIDAAANTSDASMEVIATTHSQFVVNRDVESALTGWTDLWNAGFTTLSRPSGDAHSGSYAIRADSSSATSVQGGFNNYATSMRWVSSTVADKPYTASAWVKGGGVTGLNICVRLTEYTSSNVNVGATETCSQAFNNNWRQITHTRTVSADGNSLAMAVYAGNLRNDRYLLADDFSLIAPN
ncbi:MAG TPA: SdrD B-like domain-containing protein [Candidatus Saccharimonadales bacterium]|nr:SdrD B-like domain-containing protein [Candidatus Saccharimonadales bacterium]